MKIRHLEFLVGLFMLLGIIALVLMALRVSGISLQQSHETYKIKARFENLGGLTERAKVSISGVNVGRVSRIYLDPKWYNAVVEMEINRDKIKHLSIDSSAAILTSGLLGEKYIGLSVGAEDEYLKDGDWLEETQSALVLEELISRFIFSKTSK